MVCGQGAIRLFSPHVPGLPCHTEEGGAWRVDTPVSGLGSGEWNSGQAAGFGITLSTMPHGEGQNGTWVALGQDRAANEAGGNMSPSNSQGSGARAAAKKVRVTPTLVMVAR
jgi:hypothetical protein